MPVPPDLDYAEVRGLSIEARQTLSRQRPETIGQAARQPASGPAVAARRPWGNQPYDLQRRSADGNANPDLPVRAAAGTTSPVYPAAAKQQRQSGKDRQQRHGKPALQ
jgi:hypothetical protein